MRCFAIQKQLVSNLVGGDIAMLLRRLSVVVVKLSDQFPRLMTVSGHVQVFNFGCHEDCRISDVALITSSPAVMVLLSKGLFS